MPDAAAPVESLPVASDPVTEPQTPTDPLPVATEATASPEAADPTTPPVQDAPVATDGEAVVSTEAPDAPAPEAVAEPVAVEAAILAPVDRVGGIPDAGDSGAVAATEAASLVAAAASQPITEEPDAASNPVEPVVASEPVVPADEQPQGSAIQPGQETVASLAAEPPVPQVTFPAAESVAVPVDGQVDPAATETPATGAEVKQEDVAPESVESVPTAVDTQAAPVPETDESATAADAALPADEITPPETASPGSPPVAAATEVSTTEPVAVPVAEPAEDATAADAPGTLAPATSADTLEPITVMSSDAATSPEADSGTAPPPVESAPATPLSASLGVPEDTLNACLEFAATVDGGKHTSRALLRAVNQHFADLEFRDRVSLARKIEKAFELKSPGA